MRFRTRQLVLATGMAQPAPDAIAYEIRVEEALQQRPAALELYCSLVYDAEMEIIDKPVIAMFLSRLFRNEPGLVEETNKFLDEYAIELQSTQITEDRTKQDVQTEDENTLYSYRQFLNEFSLSD